MELTDSQRAKLLGSSLKEKLLDFDLCHYHAKTLMLEVIIYLNISSDPEEDVLLPSHFESTKEYRQYLIQKHKLMISKQVPKMIEELKGLGMIIDSDFQADESILATGSYLGIKRCLDLPFVKAVIDANTPINIFQ